MRPHKPMSSDATEFSPLKAVNAEHISIFAALTLVMATAAGKLKNCSGDLNKCIVSN
jgi:hypothetical protein